MTQRTLLILAIGLMAVGLLVEGVAVPIFDQPAASQVPLQQGLGTQGPHHGKFPSGPGFGPGFRPGGGFPGAPGRHHRPAPSPEPSESPNV